LHVATTVENTLVLGLAGDDVVLLASTLEEAGDTLDAHVVALGSSGCEDDLLGVGANEFCNVGSGLLDTFIRLPTVGVGSRMRVSVQTSKVGQHGIQDSRIGRGGCLGIEVDGAGSLVHNGGLLEDSSSGAHHSIGAHAGGGHCSILRLYASLGEEGLLVSLDGRFDIDSGISWRALRDI
jgi:hypothetical protein